MKANQYNQNNQNPYDISKTINTRLQNPSPGKIKMNNSVTAKMFPNQKNPQQPQHPQ